MSKTSLPLQSNIIATMMSGMSKATTGLILHVVNKVQLIITKSGKEMAHNSKNLSSTIYSVAFFELDCMLTWLVRSLGMTWLKLNCNCCK